MAPNSEPTRTRISSVLDITIEDLEVCNTTQITMCDWCGAQILGPWAIDHYCVCVACGNLTHRGDFF